VGKLLKFLLRPSVSLLLSIGALVAYPLSVGPAVWVMWNFHVPEIARAGFSYIYSPLVSVAGKSETVGRGLEGYAGFWVDGSQEAATKFKPWWPEPPPFLIEVTGTLIGAWLVWNLVRWVNQRSTRSA
jgi:hypothetical protein